MNDESTIRESQETQDLIVRLEELAVKIDDAQNNCTRVFAELKADYNAILADIKLEFHSSVINAEKFGYDLIPDIPLEDKKIKSAWIALFKHHNGATADEISEDLHRHRTTVSTYLNTLVLMGYAKKERIGHEIYYKAVLNQSKGSP